ncbi:hypothetical protein [Leadbetterella sp. DM7]|uniref:hypothetical protein n=1 Tax=Leadbetterella sp. DM7 TaxID=3235085 RepID=UPI00349EA4AE
MKVFKGDIKPNYKHVLKWLNKNSTLILSAVGATIAFLFTMFQIDKQHEATLELEKNRLKGQLLVDIWNNRDSLHIKKRIEFLIDAKIIEDEDSLIRRLAATSYKLPSLKIGTTLPFVTVSSSKHPCYIFDCEQKAVTVWQGDTLWLHVLLENMNDFTFKNVAIHTNMSSYRGQGGEIESKLLIGGYIRASDRIVYKVLDEDIDVIRALELSYIKNSAQIHQFVGGIPQLINDEDVTITSIKFNFKEVPPGTQSIITMAFLTKVRAGGVIRFKPNS